MHADSAWHVHMQNNRLPSHCIVVIAMVLGFIYVFTNPDTSLEPLDLRKPYNADSLLAAFTVPVDPRATPLVTPRTMAPAPLTSTTSSAAASRGTNDSASAHGTAQPSGATSMSEEESDREARVWQENVRLSQEVLTLLRVVLVDPVLGRSGN